MAQYFRHGMAQKKDLHKRKSVCVCGGGGGPGGILI